MDSANELPPTGQEAPSEFANLTINDIKSDLNEKFMRGQMPAKDFIDRMLNIATNNQRLDRYALQAISIALGNERYSSQMTDGYTNAMLQKGDENEQMQGVASALTPEHLKMLRGFFTRKISPMYAEEAYLFSLSHAPGQANHEDIQVLCKQFEGEPPVLSDKPRQRPVYYPQKILDIMSTAKTVFSQRPDLLDDTATDTIHRLPEMITKGDLLYRGQYDKRDITKESLLQAAQQLQQLPKNK